MDGNLEKRIRRHILSKTYRFLGVVQPAFRETAKKEMQEQGFNVVGEVEGGIEFEGSLQEGWRANLVLRTISRVYCRIASFRAGAREELYRKARGISWELWIDPTVPVRIEASAHASRIHHEGVMRDTLMEAIQDRWVDKAVGVPTPFEGDVDQAREDPTQRILVHSEGYRCTISLDMSGEGLYRRGYRSIPGEAPIREDIAAALLFELGWKGRGILCDPMTGSGTFSIEAAQIGLRIPPGWNRWFQFQHWPSFRNPRWTFVKKQVVSNDSTMFQNTEGLYKNRLGIEKPFCFASDWETSAVEAARANSRNAGVETCILFEQKDFFTLNGEYIVSRIKNPGERYLVLNPPYGKRLEADRKYPIRLWEHIRKSFPRWKILLLLPVSFDLSSRSMEEGRRILFRHGGLRIQALLFKTD